MEELIKKAAILQEALPYMRRFQGRTFVIKYGGHAMTEAPLQESFARDVVLLRYVGIQPIVVHGGGPQIDATLARMGLTPRRVQGLRVTDDETMDVVSMVLRGRVNREIVATLQHHGGQAVGLSGIDGGLLLAEKLPPVQTGCGPVDTGRVGAIKDVRAEVLLALLSSTLIPVIAPIAADSQGQPLNINADTVAGEIAAAVGAEKLLLMTDTEGVLDAKKQLIKSLTPDVIKRFRSDGVITGGMIPKVECGLRAVFGGVHKCHIIDGRRQHAILLEIFTDSGIGTEIVRRGGARRGEKRAR